MAEQELIDNETKAAFEAVDEEGNGKITHQQLRTCLRSLTGVKKLPDKIVNSVLEEADQDKSGWINYEEFCNAIGTVTLLETVIHLFLTCDRDKSGFISPAELRAAVANLPAAPHNNLHAEEILAQCDVNQDGYLSFEEFANHMLEEEEEGNVQM